MKKTGLVLAATAALAFASAGIVGSFSPAQAAGVKCTGANACKGQSACKTATSACKGMNACKGQGWTETRDVVSCTSKGGKVI